MALQSSNAAVYAVFDTAELLENILIYLPFFDLVRCQRTSTQFNYVVRASTALRRKLFLQQSATSQEWRLLNANGSLDSVAFIPAAEDSNDDGHVYTPTRVNPLLRQNTTFFNPNVQSSAKRARLCRGESLCPSERTLLGAVESSIRSGQAQSWHRMFLTNPPCKQVKFHAYWRIGTTRFMTISNVSNSQGVRFDELIRASLEETSEVYLMNEAEALLMSVAGLRADRRPGKSLRDRIFEHGEAVSVDLSAASHMWLPGMISPREAEWKSIVNS